ncbi:MAG: hypothetical protein ACK4NR_00635 [Micavibrio sp.]
MIFGIDVGSAAWFHFGVIREEKMRVFIIFLVTFFWGWLSINSGFAIYEGSRAYAEGVEPSRPERFIDLFHNEKGRFVTAEATKYIKACCEQSEDAIHLLVKNGFKISIVDDASQVSKLNKHWRTEKDSFDKFIFGSRGPGLSRFWKFFSRYSIALFVKDNEVKRVYAVVDTTYP